MKKILLAAMAFAALAACNKAEVIETQEGEAIEFSNAFVNNATKATDPTYGAVALTSFDVYGTVTGTAGTINIFNGAEVTGSVGANVWACDVKQYWIADAAYKFAAVVDANGVQQDANTKMPTALTYETDGQKDLLYAEATATGKASSNDKVNFSFNHLLSKAQFTVTSNAADGYHHNVTNIKVSNFETGTYTIAGGTWAGETSTQIAFGNVEQVTAAGGAKTNATQMLLIPNTGDFTVSFTVEIWNGTTKLGTQDYTKTVTQDLVKGNAYDFNLALTVGELIQFTVTSNPSWAGETDVTIQ